MKKIFFIIAITVVTATQAQNTMNYADLTVFRPGFKNFIAELHTDGNNSREHTLLKDNNGNKIIFSAAVGALNYVSRDGWVLISSFQDQGQLHFILKK